MQGCLQAAREAGSARRLVPSLAACERERRGGGRLRVWGNGAARLHAVTRWAGVAPANAARLISCDRVLPPGDHSITKGKR